MFTCIENSAQAVAWKHHEKVSLSGFLSAYTTTRVWRKLWPPTSPSHHCPWGRWVPCPLQCPAPPTQVEVNPRARVLTQGLAKEEPQGSCQLRHQKPPALRPQLPASHWCHLKKTKTQMWRSKLRAVRNVGERRCVEIFLPIWPNSVMTTCVKSCWFVISFVSFQQSLRLCPPCRHRPSLRPAAQPRTWAHQVLKGPSAPSYQLRARPWQQHLSLPQWPRQNWG